MKLYIVDICGSIFSENTTIGAVKYFLIKKNKYYLYALFILISSKLSPFFFLEKIFNFNIIKYLIFFSLRKESVVEFKKIVEGYVVDLLKTKKNSKVWEIIENKNKDDIVFLASSSIEPVVAAISAATGISYYVASELEHKNGFFTGRYVMDIAGCKEDALIKKYSLNLMKSAGWYVISDNISDRSLIEKAEKAYVVLYKRWHRYRWKKMKLNFIEVY